MNNPLAGTDPTGYAAKNEIKEEQAPVYIHVKRTGSAITKKVEVTATGSADGKSAVYTFSGADSGARNTARNAVAGKLSSASLSVKDIGSQQTISQDGGTRSGGQGGTSGGQSPLGDTIKQAGSDLLTSVTDKVGELSSDALDGVSWRLNAVKDGVASDFEDGFWEGVVRFTGGRNGDDALAEMRQNFLSTSIIAGPLKDLDKKVVSAAFAGELTKRNGGMTFGQWLKTGFKTAPHLQTKAATAGFVARTTAINAVVITTAYEGWNGFGSAIRVGINRGARNISDWVNDKKYAK